MNNKDMLQVIEVFKKRNNFLITSHINPEGDSIGSQLAVFDLLKRMGKNAVMVNQDEVPENLCFLPGIENIKPEVPADFRVEVAVLLDCPVKERVGYVMNYIDDAVFMVNIDHHVSNEYYGDVNWVESEMSSVGEMAYHLIREMGGDLSKNVALAIYAALVTDTGMFNYDNTGKGTHLVAGEAIHAGVSPKLVYSEIFEKKPLFYLKVLGKVLSTVKVEENGLVAYMTLTRRMLEEEGVSSVSTEEFIGYPRSIKGVEVAVFFNENPSDPELVNVSFRSNGKIDVNRIAAQFGGGGHQKASGCLMRTSIEEAKEKILGEVRKAVRGSSRTGGHGSGGNA